MRKKRSNEHPMYKWAFKSNLSGSVQIGMQRIGIMAHLGVLKDIFLSKNPCFSQDIPRLK